MIQIKDLRELTEGQEFNAVGLKEELCREFSLNFLSCVKYSVLHRADRNLEVVGYLMIFVTGGMHFKGYE
jgi:hypothetical protein